MRQDDRDVAVTANPPATSNNKQSDTNRAASQTGDAKQADGKLSVFISYSRKDHAFAKELLTGLEIAGFEPFLDTQDILPESHGKTGWAV